MSKQYGYIGPSQDQAWGSNKGVLSVNDAADLVKDNKVSSDMGYEFISQQTFDNTILYFTDLKADKYIQHLFIFKDIQLGTNSDLSIRGRLKGLDYHSASDYRHVGIDTTNNATARVEYKHNGLNRARLYENWLDSDDAANGFLLLTHLYDSHKGLHGYSQFGHGYSTNLIHHEFNFIDLDIAGQYDAIQIGKAATSTVQSGTVTLLGLRNPITPNAVINAGIATGAT